MNPQHNPTGLICLAGSTPEALVGTLEIKPFQARQILRWVHQKQQFDPDQMTDLSLELRRRLKEQVCTNALELLRTDVSAAAPGTKKALFRLHDNETIESVLIRDEQRRTVCLSTQVGCAIKCAFCATGMSGYKRNLTISEIVEQALFMLRDEPLTGEGIPKPNIVYMGMGEPFRNYDAVVGSIHILMASWGLNIGARKITVSTSGDIPGIERFAHESWQVRLSVSLHAANDTLRTKLVPLNKKYPLENLLAALSGYVITTGRQITFEWTLIKDVNDQPRDAEELAAVVHRLGAKRASVNLIPLNPVSGLPYATSPWPVCTRFRDLLDQRGVTVTLRKERGRDINAACGQLARRHTE